MMTVEMKKLVVEKILDRVEKIKGDFHDDFLAQGIRSEVARAFGISRYAKEYDEIGYFAFYEIKDWYKAHKLVVEPYDRYSYGDF